MKNLFIPSLLLIHVSLTSNLIVGVSLKKSSDFFAEMKNSSDKFWKIFTLERTKRKFDSFVASEGGVVEPSRNLPPPGFGSFSLPKESFKIAKFIFNKNMKPKMASKFTTNMIEEKADSFETSRNGRSKSRFFEHRTVPAGCEDTRGFHFEGETWYSRGCRRHKCLHFRGKYFVETDSCDTEIYNTTYKCIIEANLDENYPNCCPKYVCNPDNLGNRVNV